MFKFVKRIVNGCKDLEGYGPHPGTGIVSVYIFIAGLAGAQKGSWAGFFGGLAIGTLFFAPMFLYGAYSRGKLYEQDQVRLLRTIKEA